MGQGQSLVWTFPNSSVPMFIQSRQHNPKGFSLDPPHVAWLLPSGGTILNSRNSFITNIINMQTTVAFSAPVARPATGTFLLRVVCLLPYLVYSLRSGPTL